MLWSFALEICNIGKPLFMRLRVMGRHLPLLQHSTGPIFALASLSCHVNRAIGEIKN